ncbi:hypothetical protein AAG906_005403 [Vitis piasezkii]
MMTSKNFVQPTILLFDGHYDHWSMLMENFLRSKEYWQDSMKKKFQGSTKAKRQQLQALRIEFEILCMKTGETISDFFSRTMKIFQSLTPKFNYGVCSIEESKDLDILSIDELQGSLLVHEHKMVQQDKEEQALQVSTNNPSSTTSKVDKGKGRGRGRDRGKGRGYNDRRQQQKPEDNQVHDSQGRERGRGSHHSTTYRQKSGDKSNIECFRCHRYEHGEKSNFAEKQEEGVSLLMACYAKEETHQNMWYLDTGCSNHMCGDKNAFSKLDESFRNTVKFGDNSIVSVMGKGNKVDEIVIKERVCKIQDLKKGLIAQVHMTANRVFPLYLHSATNLCFSTKMEDVSRLRHFRYGHLNFGGLKTL